MTTTTAVTNSQPQRAGALETSALVGFRLFQALGWRIGAGALAFTACPVAFVGYWGVHLVERCFDITKPGRAGSYTICNNYGAEHLFGWIALGFALLCLVAAVGLWRRGGAVRDVEILAERVEGGAQ